MNDIEILQQMIVLDAQVPLEPNQGRRPSVKLTDKKGETTVEIKGVPYDSIVIRAEDFKDPLTVFVGSKGERRRADFVIVSNEERVKWIICIETQAGDIKNPEHVEGQLKGAQCFISYCKCIGKSFWESEVFLDDYEYRFISMTNLNIRKQRTGIFRSKGELHSRPDVFLKISEAPILHFSRLLHKAS